jgi:hypothetical protein
MVDSGTYGLVTRGIAVLALLLTLGATFALSAVLPVGVAAVIAIIFVGPTVHIVVGTLMERRPERWGNFGSGIIVAGITYPLLLWIGGTIYIGVNRSVALAVVVFLAPLVLLVLAALLWNENRGPLRRAERDGRALAARHGWRFVADGTEALRDHWASTAGRYTEVTAHSVVAGETGGWPVTICATVDHGARRDNDATVTWLVHLPVSLPRTVAVPYNSREFQRWAEGPPWEATPVQGYPLSADDLYVASADPAFGHAIATPAVRRATIEGDIMFWRIVGRDLTLARRVAARKPTEDLLRWLVTVAQALPADALGQYGTPPPSHPLPFREPAPPVDDPGYRPGTPAS